MPLLRVRGRSHRHGSPPAQVARGRQLEAAVAPGAMSIVLVAAGVGLFILSAI